MLKSIGLIAVGVVAGYVTALLVHSGNNSTMPPSGPSPTAQLPRPSHDVSISVGQDSAFVDGQTASSHLPTNGKSESRFETNEDMHSALLESAKRNYLQALQMENEQLIAAGFSMSRIQWLRDRSEQLESDRRKAETERLWQGVAPEIDLAYLNDNQDLDLINEIGVDEYERYRKATGRQVSVPVESVLPGSIADKAGLRPGDEIIRYGDERIFGRGQITKISDRAKPGTRLTLVVQREGEQMQFVVPAGALGITSPMPLPSRSKVYKRGFEGNGSQP